MRVVSMIVACAMAAGAAANAQTPRRSAPTEAVGPADETICRRFLRTGTLADYYRVCKTRGEWDRERRNIRSGINLIDSCRFRHSGNSALCPL